MSYEYKKFNNDAVEIFYDINQGISWLTKIELCFLFHFFF